MVPGSVPASQNPDGAVAKNVAKSASDLGTQTTTDLGVALQNIGTGKGLGILAPLGKACANAWQAITGKTFNLSGLGISTTGATNGNV
jgi:hypothetical protein